MPLFLTESAHWGLALVPVLILLTIFVWLDAFKLMSFREIVLLLGLGGLCAAAAYPVSGVSLDRLPTGFSIYSPLLAMMGAAMLAPLAIIAMFQFGTSEAQAWLAAESVEHRAQLDALRADRWPEIPSGRKIATLAERLGPVAAKRIRRYWELQAF